MPFQEPYSTVMDFEELFEDPLINIEYPGDVPYRCELITEIGLRAEIALANLRPVVESVTAIFQSIKANAEPTAEGTS